MVNGWCCLEPWNFMTFQKHLGMEKIIIPSDESSIIFQVGLGRKTTTQRPGHATGTDFLENILRKYGLEFPLYMYIKPFNVSV